MDMFPGVIDPTELCLVPGWLKNTPGPLYYVALPMNYSSQNNFRAYGAGGYTSIDDALKQYEERIANKWPTFGIIRATDGGCRVERRNEDEETAERLPRVDFGTW